MNAQAEEIQRDLAYVKTVVDRAQAPGPAVVWYLWAAIVLAGFALADLAPQRVGLFWLVAGPAGFALSAWLGRRHDRAVGQESAREGMRHMLHWGGMLVACFLVAPLAIVRGWSGEAMGQAILLVVALGYWLAGVHLVGALRWVALLVVAGFGITLVAGAYAWTIAGVLVALGLVVTGARSDGDR